MLIMCCLISVLKSRPEENPWETLFEKVGDARRTGLGELNPGVGHLGCLELNATSFSRQLGSLSKKY